VRRRLQGKQKQCVISHHNEGSLGEMSAILRALELREEVFLFEAARCLLEALREETSLRSSMLRILRRSLPARVSRMRRAQCWRRKVRPSFKNMA